MIIGITGRSGDGKSTFTNYLNSLIPNSRVISIDNIDFSVLINHREELIQLYGPEIIIDGKLNVDLISKYPEIRMAIHQISRDDLIKSALHEVEMALKEKTMVLIEWYRLTELKELWDLCDYHILVHSIDPKKRFDNLVKRERQKNIFIAESMEEEFRRRDFSIPEYEKLTYDFTVVNNYDESLLESAISICASFKDSKTGKFRKRIK